MGNFSEVETKIMLTVPNVQDFTIEKSRDQSRHGSCTVASGNMNGISPKLLKFIILMKKVFIEQLLDTLGCLIS